MTNSQENLTREAKVKEAKDNISLFLSVLEITMKNMDVSIGWDKKRDKLVLAHNKTKMLSRIDLEKLNSTVFAEDKEEGEDKEEDGTN